MDVDVLIDIVIGEVTGKGCTICHTAGIAMFEPDGMSVLMAGY